MPVPQRSAERAKHQKIRLHTQEEMLRAAIAKIQNKITAIKFSERREAQRALEAASSTRRD
jgi:hypothetical protein